MTRTNLIFWSLYGATICALTGLLIGWALSALLEVAFSWFTLSPIYVMIPTGTVYGLIYGGKIAQNRDSIVQ